MSFKFNLPKKEHLLKSGQFNHIFNNGNKLRFKGYSIFFEESHLNLNRLGLVVPKRYIKLATARNRIKRLLREAYRLSKPKINTGYDIVLYVNKDINTLVQAEEIVSCLQKALNKNKK